MTLIGITVATRYAWSPLIIINTTREVRGEEIVEGCIFGSRAKMRARIFTRIRHIMARRVRRL